MPSSILSDPTSLDVVELPPSLTELWRTGRGTGRTLLFARLTSPFRIPSGPL